MGALLILIVNIITACLLWDCIKTIDKWERKRGKKEMTDKEAADILYSICGYLGLTAPMLKYRVLSGWKLMPPPRLSEECWGTPTFGEASPELMLGETRPRLLTDPNWRIKP